MSTSQAKRPESVQYWKEGWDAGRVGFHKTDVHHMLERHLDKITPDGKPNKIFFPLCGKAVDMKWLADKGFTVVGVDGVHLALEQFFSEQGLEFTKDASKPTLFKSKDDKIRLYCNNIVEFSPDVEGTFDSIWDRGSMVALDRNVVPRYVQVLKSLLRPGGRILMEVFEYDVAIMNDLDDDLRKPPPPFPVYEDEIRSLYSPEYSVEIVDRDKRLLCEKEIELVIYLITKN